MTNKRKTMEVVMGDVMSRAEKTERMRRYGSSLREVRRLGEEMARWRSMAEGLGGSILTHLGKQGTQRNPLEESVERIVLLEEELAGKLDAALRLRREVDGAIGRLCDVRLRDVLRLRYLDGRSLAHIAEEMGYSERQVFNLHRQALDAVKLG